MTPTNTYGSKELALEKEGTVHLKTNPEKEQVSDGNVHTKHESLKPWNDIPLWQQEDNHFIETGYREVSGSLSESLGSLGHLHNESVNIYSHLVGSVLFLVLPLWIFNTEIPPRYRVATPVDITVCCIYLTGVALCFLFSATFHTLKNHSPWVSKLGLKFDLQGIVILIWGASVPLTYYGFHCDRKLQWAYWSLVSAFAIACSVLTFQPNFTLASMRPLRVLIFGSFILSSTIPIIHGVGKYGWALQSQRMGLSWVFPTLALNSTGAAAYIFGFPERWIQRKFDIFGASHQWLHIMVVLAGIAHTFGVLQAFDFLHAHFEECPII